MSKAIFPGSFDPFTIGHADIVDRGLKIFDKIVIAIGINQTKPHLHDTETRLQSISQTYADNPNIEVCTYTGLTVDFARRLGINIILRGVRSIKDYEYERELADMNFKLTGIETVLLFSKPELASISSSALRELSYFGKDISSFIP